MKLRASYSLSESAKKPENSSSSESDTNGDSSSSSNMAAVVFSKMEVYRTQIDRWQNVSMVQLFHMTQINIYI